MTEEQIQIMKHTDSRAACGLYCGDSPDMQDLVKKGFMVLVGGKSFVPDPYFALTNKGKKYLRELYIQKEKSK